MVLLAGPPPPPLRLARLAAHTRLRLTQARPEMVGICPVMVHVNYIPGHHLKLQHLKQRGVWELDDRLDCRVSSALDAAQRCPSQS